MHVQLSTYLLSYILPLHLLLSGVSIVQASTTHDINVGKGGLVYDPEQVTAAKGDMLRFHFYGPKHRVAQSTFEVQCKPGDGNIFSGDMKVDGDGEGDKVFDVTVNDTTPIFIYCSVEDHCLKGMAMAVNPPDNGSLSEYKSSAQFATVKQPDHVSGGVIADSNASGSSSASSGGASSSAASMTGSMASVTSSATMSTAPSGTSGGATKSSSTGAADSVLKQVNVGWLMALGLGGAVAGEFF